MKYLKYTLGVILFLLIGFLLIGLFQDQLDYDCDIMVEKPLVESWAVSQDVEKMAEWLSGFQKVEHISGTPGTVGAVSDVYFNTDGQEMVIRETINKIVANESISMSFTSDFMNMDYTLRMLSIDGKTKISSNTTATGNGLISKSIIALVSSTIQAQEQTNLNKLKQTIEKNTKDYFSVTEDLLKPKGVVKASKKSGLISH